MNHISYFAAPGMSEIYISNMTNKKIAEIEHLVCNSTGETPNRIKNKSRTRNMVLSRHIIFYFLKRYTRLSLKKIGLLYGGRDHTTVIHGIKTLGDLMDTEPVLKKQIELIDSILKEDIIQMQ